MEEGQQSNTAMQPHNLKLYPKERSTTHKKYRRATKILNTPRKTVKNPQKNPRNQYQHPITKKLAQQTNNTPQSKHNKEITRIANVPSVKMGNPQYSHRHDTSIAGRKP